MPDHLDELGLKIPESAAEGLTYIANRGGFGPRGWSDVSIR